MSILPICFVAAFSAAFAILGILMLLGNMDGYMMRVCKEGSIQNLPKVRKIVGANFIVDAILVPVVFYIVF